MKLDKIQLYQKIEFEGTVQGYFVRERDVNKRLSDLDITLQDNLVIIKSDRDEVMVPVPNIAFMKKSNLVETKKVTAKKS